MAAFGYSNQSRILREIPASKLQGQTAAQVSFCEYEGLCPATKKDLPGVLQEILQNYRTATFDSNFRGLILKTKQNKTKTKQRRVRARSDPCGFRFSLFPGQLFIKS